MSTTTKCLVNVFMGNPRKGWSERESLRNSRKRVQRKIRHGTRASVADPVFHCFPFIGIAICKETINTSSYYRGLGTVALCSLNVKGKSLPKPQYWMKLVTVYRATKKIYILILRHRNSSGTETEVIVILSSSIFWRTLLRRPRDSEKLFVHEVDSTAGKAKRRHSSISPPPKPKACSQPWLPLQSALPQVLSPVQQELWGVMKTSSKTSGGAAEPWQSSGLGAVQLTDRVTSFENEKELKNKTNPIKNKQHYPPSHTHKKKKTLTTTPQKQTTMKFSVQRHNVSKKCFNTGNNIHLLNAKK
ncbi:hypothetical protein EK904_000586 [Melospiza melodia maxima]|nr:hypothetical protein EK904_000586 [Melospiza melodia maxima]